MIAAAIWMLALHQVHAADEAGLAAGAPSHEGEWVNQVATDMARANDAPAVVIAIIREGEVVATSAVGVVDRGGARAVDASSIFQIASLSKIFTGIIANALIAEEVIDPDAPILTYLPDTLSEDARGKLAAVTVRDLLHHRSGLTRDTAVVVREGNDPMLEPLTEAGLLRDMEIVDMIAPAGSEYYYSNLGYGLLGYIMERASGQPYEELLARYVTRPHALGDTHVELPAEKLARLATPYRKEDPLVATHPWKTGKLVSASGVYSTTSDLARLMAAQIAAYREATASGEAYGPLLLTRDTRPAGDDRSYGYGMNLSELEVDGDSYDLLYHVGDMDGYAATWMFLPERNIGLVILTSRGGAWKEQLEVRILRHLLGMPPL